MVTLVTKVTNVIPSVDIFCPVKFSNGLMFCKLLPPSSGYKNPKAKKVRASKTLKNSYQITRCHIPEDIFTVIAVRTSDLILFTSSHALINNNINEFNSIARDVSGL